MPSEAKSPHQVALGGAIKALRVARELSQEELAWKAALHRNYVGRVERGELNLSFERLVRLAEGLGIPLSELVVLYENQLRSD